jgi:predicted small secreted protein
MSKALNLVIGVLLSATLMTGCTTHRTVERDTVYSQEDRRTGEPVAVERETTTTETSTSEDTGVISGTFNVLGEIVALPFRAVGGLIRAIF